MTVLALTTTLACILVVNVSHLAYRFLVGNLGLTHVGFYLELTQQAIHDDLQVQLAHTGDDGLSGLLIGVGTEGRVLLCQLGKAQTHLLLTHLGLRLDGNTDNRLREFHRLQNDRMLCIAQGITGGGVLQAYAAGNITGIAGLDVFAVVCVHLQNSADALIISLYRVVNAGACIHGTGVHTEEAQLTYIGVGHDLEGERRKGCVVAGRSCLLLLGIGVDALDVGNVGGGRHIVYHGVQQLLHALVAVGSTAANGYHVVGNGGLADAALDLIDGKLLTVEIFHQQLLVLLGHMLQQLVVVLIGLVLHIGGDVLHADILSKVIVVHIGLHLYQVDNTLKGILDADGQLDRNSVALQTVTHHTDYIIEIRTHDVHLIYKCHSRHMVFVSLAPYGFRLRLYAALGAKNGYRTVQHAQGTLYLYRKIYVSGGVDDIDAVAFPIGGRGGGGDGDTTLLLLLHPVHGGAAVMGLTQLVVYACVVQDTLGGGGFAGVDVRHDAYITGFL